MEERGLKTGFSPVFSVEALALALFIMLCRLSADIG